MKIAAIQMSSVADVDENLASAEQFVAEAAVGGAELVSLPENFALMPNSPAQLIECATHREAEIDARLAEMAKQHGVYLIGGSFPAASPAPDRIFGSCRVFDSNGQRLARYDKLHLFDVDVSATEAYRESDYTYPGESIEMVDSPLGVIGLTICYDMRFPELYRCLSRMGVRILSIPSAFTVPTGKAHWEVLLRARAIENLAFVIAPAQVGEHPSGRKTYGHSLVVDPWGSVLGCLESGTGILMVDIDPVAGEPLRQRFPVLDHRRIQLGDLI